MSFLRKSKKSSFTPIGCRISSHNSQVLLSSGIPSLDDLVGVPLNSITLVMTDRYSSYANLILKTFISQGLSSNQPTIVSSSDLDLSNFIDSLPSPVESQTEEEDPNDDDQISYQTIPRDSRVLGSTREDNKMRIAWRYNNLPQTQSTLGLISPQSVSSIPYCCVFDITKPRQVESFLLENSLTLISQSKLDSLYDRIFELLSQGNFFKTDQLNSNKQKVARIAIHNLASASWQIKDQLEFTLFMIKLRRLVQKTYSVCFITMPAYIYSDDLDHNSDTLVKSLSHLADCVVELESFSGTSRKLPNSYTHPPPQAPQYHGFFHIIKLPTMNSLIPGAYSKISPQDLNSLVFRVRRKRFSIETFHLPPEVNEVESTDKMVTEISHLSIGSAGVVGSTKTASNLLDF